MHYINSNLTELRFTKSLLMKRLLTALILILLNLNSSFSQCISADPFCTGTTYNFPNSTNVTDLGAVDCLGNTPNPSWYYMEIDQNGSMTFNISQTSTSGSGIDVDFAIWGPYTSLNAACAGANPFPSGSAVDCSYSSAAVETATIPNAQVGQVYVALLTNFSNTPGSISFSQTGGSGSADCSFTCGVNLTANPGPCSSNLYSLTGNLTVTSGPGISVPNTGTVTIANSCGGTPQVFNAPFTNIPYTFNNLTANGASCTVTATFSNFPNCNTTQLYTAPGPCNPTCNIATFTATPTTCSANLYSVSGSVPFTNAPSSGTLTITNSCGGTPITYNAPFTSPANFNFTGLTANGNNCTVTATFSANTSCSNTASYTAPGPCNPTCSINPFTPVPSACNSSNNQYNVSGSISFTNAPTSGTLTISNSCGGTPITYNAPFTSPANFNFTGLSANGANCNITASFSATTCSLIRPYTAPAACTTPPCITDPFCSGTLTFPAGTNQTAASTSFPNNNYGCLGSSPNPAWYYMEISQAGDVGLNITNSAGVDVDYILYGPYSSLNNANSYCNNMGTAGTGATTNTVVDCSFSGLATENAYIPSAQVGEVYVLLITNFSNSATNISFTQNSGTGSTDCSILTSCNFTNFTGVPSVCTGNNYSISGTITYTDPPTTGTLTLNNSCSPPLTFNAPFGTSTNFTFSGLTGNGNACVITATFSDDNSCSATLNYNAPNCGCPAEIGSYNTTITGNSNSLTKLCYGDQFTLSNTNWTPPNEVIGATTPGSANYDPNAPTYDPGMAWLVYGCPPTVALTPSANQQINNDPCLLGVYDTIPNMTDINDLTLINSLPAGSFTNNTLYFVPLTMYSIVDGIYSYIVLPEPDCYELGTPFSIQYLPQITYTQTTNCANATATVTLSGGSPQLNGTNFSVVPGSLSPSSANFVNTTTGNGGTIVIGNLTTGPYSFDIVDDNGCPKTISGNFIGAETASISYPDNLYCLNEPPALPTITGTQGGTFTSGAGLSINSTTGIIDFQNTIPGAYTITYTTPGTLCPGTATFNLTVEDFPIVDGGPDQTLCIGIPVILNATGAISYVWNNGLQNGVPYLPNFGENTFNVIGTTLAGCTGYDTVLVNVITDCNPDIDIVFWVPNTFTPDGDQYNQTFKPIFYSGFDPFAFDMFIFNRWGELIWESHDVNVGWDGATRKGNKVADGTYTWKIRFKLLTNDEKKTVVGHVNVLR